MEVELVDVLTVVKVVVGGGGSDVTACGGGCSG